jgi:protein-tyrosine phosphatase
MLEGQPNFRDLGGSRTVGSSLVATGEVYRSGELSALTDADLSQLEDLGIRTVVDLRSEPEEALQPDRIPVSATYRPIPALPGGAGSAVEQFLRSFDPADFPPWEDVYRTLIREQTAVFRSLIRLVADPEARPLVFHCSTGKDRTGVAAALLLSMLGVAWRDVEDDYLRSNAFLNASRPEIMDRWARGLEERGVRLDLNTRKQLEHFLLVEPSYLAAARDEMISLDGSVDAYIRRSLRIEDGVRDTLRRQLLR